MDRLDTLEAQSIYILREAYANFDNLGLLWSLGKDSNVMVWLAKKAFCGHIPFPLIFCDTGKKFSEMYAFQRRFTAFCAGVCRSVAHTGVTINHIQPGFFDTDRYRSGIDAMANQLKITHDQAHEKRIQEVPAKRAGTPEEFGEAAAFLCSLQAGYITGQSLLLDGGLFNSSF
ncbi:SDR family oxidoreductase [Alphaproteobacteria bacterium]|nr:SDR family oxidoreductase [Alphaproteobacteria bacterium]